MSCDKILFESDDMAITPERIHDEIAHFGNSYINTTHKIIQYSAELDKGGEVFTRCASLILSNFGMTRSGRFLGEENQKDILEKIWKEIGDHLVEIRNSINNSRLSRDRYLLELVSHSRENLIDRIWILTKQLLPLTMGETSYGLVGASKILFAVFPEIVLPIDNRQWLHVFKTVDLGDVLKRMVSDIQRWEKTTGKHLNELGSSKGLTTLPSVYNVMAMKARPKNP